MKSLEYLDTVGDKQSLLLKLGASEVAYAYFPCGDFGDVCAPLYRGTLNTKSETGVQALAEFRAHWKGQGYDDKYIGSFLKNLDSDRKLERFLGNDVEGRDTIGTAHAVVEGLPSLSAIISNLRVAEIETGEGFDGITELFQRVTNALGVRVFGIKYCYSNSGGSKGKAAMLAALTKAFPILATNRTEFQLVNPPEKELGYTFASDWQKWGVSPKAAWIIHATYAGCRFVLMCEAPDSYGRSYPGLYLKMNVGGGGQGGYDRTSFSWYGYSDAMNILDLYSGDVLSSAPKSSYAKAMPSSDLVLLNPELRDWKFMPTPLVRDFFTTGDVSVSPDLSTNYPCKAIKVAGGKTSFVTHSHALTAVYEQEFLGPNDKAKAKIQNVKGMRDQAMLCYYTDDANVPALLTDISKEKVRAFRDIESKEKFSSGWTIGQAIDKVKKNRNKSIFVVGLSAMDDVSIYPSIPTGLVKPFQRENPVYNLGKLGPDQYYLMDGKKRLSPPEIRWALMYDVAAIPADRLSLLQTQYLSNKRLSDYLDPVTAPSNPMAFDPRLFVRNGMLKDNIGEDGVYRLALAAKGGKDYNDDIEEVLGKVVKVMS